MRITGLAAFFGNTFLFLVYSVFVAFDIFSLIQVSGLRTIIFWILFSIMIGGFCLLFLGSRLQKVLEKSETKIKGTSNQIDQVNLSKSDAEFFNQQQEYVTPKGPEGRGTMKLFGISVLVIVLAILFWGLSLNSLARGFYAYSVALGAITVACLVALVSGNVSEDLWRAYLGGYHVHESFIGIYFAIIGGPMMALAVSPVEFYLGLAYIISGVFLVGRDWKDVVQGKFLVHKSKEPDYEQYAAIKAKKKEIQGT